VRYIQALDDEQFSIRIQGLSGAARGATDATALKVTISIDGGATKKRIIIRLDRSRDAYIVDVADFKVYKEGQWLRCGYIFGKMTLGKQGQM